MSRRTNCSRQTLPILGFAALITVAVTPRPLPAQQPVVDLALPTLSLESGRATPDSAARSQTPPPGTTGVVAAAGGAAALVALLLADEPSREVVQGWRGEGSEEVARFGRWYGDWKSSAPYLLGGTLLIGIATKGAHGIADAAAVVAGTFAGSMSSEMLNQTLGRRRPNEGRGQWSFTPFNGHASFPSGHTAFAFGFAGSVDAVTKGWFPAALAYGAASLTGLSRMHDDKHWLSDVVAGALIGTFVSRATASRVRSLLSGGREAESDSAADGSSRGDRKPALDPKSSPRVRWIAGPAYLGLELRF